MPREGHRCRQVEPEVLGERVRAGIAQGRREGRPHGRPQTASLKADDIRRLKAERERHSGIAQRLGNGRTSVRASWRRADAQRPCARTAHTSRTGLAGRTPYDYLFKPLDLHQLQTVVGEAVEVARRMREPAVVTETLPDHDFDGAIIGTCPAMREVYKAIGRVAAQDVPVLITGESGTGKELVARAVYQHGPRAKAPFLALNCAAIPENLLESELFGHEKGAFTGADRRRIGKFEQCDSGTIFLDEVGDMPPALQAKVLRLMQEQAFERVGGSETVRTDVRLIAATHRDLKTWLDEGKFRPDLYYRLSVFTLHLPPLRERGDDLPLLVRQYLRRFGREMGREVVGVAPAAMDRLRGYSWPGNIRELQNVLRQALLRAQGQVLLSEFLPELPQALAPAGSKDDSAPTGRGSDLDSFIRRQLAAGTDGLHEETQRWVDRILLPLVLEHTQGNQKQAALILGIARKTLRDRLRELGVTIQRLIEVDEAEEG
jgi:DNA-binding NtrC family response regulator